jgi:hypothetical protein
MSHTFGCVIGENSLVNGNVSSRCGVALTSALVPKTKAVARLVLR